MTQHDHNDYDKENDDDNDDDIDYAKGQHGCNEVTLHNFIKSIGI